MFEGVAEGGFILSLQIGELARIPGGLEKQVVSLEGPKSSQT